MAGKQTMLRELVSLLVLERLAAVDPWCDWGENHLTEFEWLEWEGDRPDEYK